MSYVTLFSVCSLYYITHDSCHSVVHWTYSRDFSFMIPHIFFFSDGTLYPALYICHPTYCTFHCFLKYNFLHCYSHNTWQKFTILPCFRRKEPISSDRQSLVSLFLLSVCLNFYVSDVLSQIFWCFI
jgi:hypothetical protein